MEKIEFSVAGGGALITRLRKRGILRRDQLSIPARMAIAATVTWLPLLVLTAKEGLATGTKVRIPYVLDFIQYARFLVSLPIAIWAEGFISPRFEAVLRGFLRNDVITGEDVPRFRKAIARANAMKDSVTVELILVALTYLYIALGLTRNPPPGLVTWNHAESGISAPVTSAELWWTWVSMPIFLFVWVRWLWRQLVWALLLFRISRFNLRLVATHPDQTGGLTFVGIGHRRFAALVFAMASIASGGIAEEILFGSRSLNTFETELAVLFVLCLLVTLGPLLVFTPVLVRAKLKGVGDYGTLSAAYTQDFDRKWVRAPRPPRGQLLGNPDIQSLADMMNSYSGAARMRTIIPERKTVVIYLIAFLAPLSPLLLTIMPMKEILSALFKLLAG